ncbi:hypothetical protein QJQ45_008672 [Haematococcus lacustris]|nr:hypothetical protein QJQ45_008672 [Haematococcus lacustris]
MSAKPKNTSHVGGQPPGKPFGLAAHSSGHEHSIAPVGGFIRAEMSKMSKGDGDYEICNDFILDDWLRQKLAVTEEELSKERDCVSHLTGRMGGSCDIRGKEDTNVPGEM